MFWKTGFIFFNLLICLIIKQSFKNISLGNYIQDDSGVPSFKIMHK